MSGAHTAPPQGWLRRHRWWLVAAPLSLALVLAASSYRVRTFYYENGYHRELTTATAGQWVRVDDEMVDGTRLRPRRLELRLDSVKPHQGDVDAKYDLRPAQLPDDVTAYDVKLSIRGADESAQNCSVWLVDWQGRRFGADILDDPFDQETRCWPALEDGAAPPESYTSTLVVVAPSDAQLKAVRVAWNWPGYVTLSLPR